jgi:DNA-binding response OmpR family regulator
LSDRVDVARLGGRAFLHKPVSIEQIFQTVTQVLNQNQTRAVEAKVMVVDDDPILLATLCSMLKPWGMNVTTLENPQQFWEVLQAVAPDLLVLDLEINNDISDRKQVEATLQETERRCATSWRTCA